MKAPAKNIVVNDGGFAGVTFAREQRRRLSNGCTLILFSEGSYLTFNSKPDHRAENAFRLDIPSVRCTNVQLKDTAAGLVLAYEVRFDLWRRHRRARIGLLAEGSWL